MRQQSTDNVILDRVSVKKIRGELKETVLASDNKVEEEREKERENCQEKKDLLQCQKIKLIVK